MTFLFSQNFILRFLKKMKIFQILQNEEKTLEKKNFSLFKETRLFFKKEKPILIHKLCIGIELLNKKNFHFCLDTAQMSN